MAALINKLIKMEEEDKPELPESGCVDTVAREQITALTEEKMNKQQGAENAGALLRVGDDGNVVTVNTSKEIYAKPTTGKNIVFGEWKPGRFKDGIWGGAAKLGHEIGINEKFPVVPGAEYTISWQTKVTACTEAILYVHMFDRNMDFISFLYAAYPHVTGPASFKVVNNAYYISIHIYLNGKPTDATIEQLYPGGLQIEKGKVATGYEPYEAVYEICLDPLAVYDNMAQAGVVPDRMAVPGYYFTNNYLTQKCDRIRELAGACAGNGDLFAFVTDQHWPLNAQKSPALMKYIADKTYMPRVFSGGDTADYASEDYAKTLAAAFAGGVHHVMGNHDYFGDVDGNKLAFIFDMGKSGQIGNTQRHYYYVDNPQQKIRYIVLSAFDNNAGEIVSAYETAQVEWLTNTALKVEAGWTVLVFTHVLYYGSQSTQTLYTTPTGADNIVAALDGAECEVACVIQGHAHLDRICHTPGGIPVVLTTCDKYSPWIDNGTDMEPWLSNRVEGTITEQAFDVVVLDKAQRKLTFVRIGAPADDWTDGTSTGTVEERVVTY